MDALLLKPFSFSLGATCIKVYIDSSTEVGPSQVALAHCLASLVQKGSVNLTGSRVLQLECGSSGLAGLLAALAGAHTVLASSAITAQLRVNVEGVISVPFWLESLDWTTS